MGPSNHKMFALRNEKGLVLPVVLIVLAVVTAMGGAAVVLTRTDLKIGGNYRDIVVAFNLAEAGTAHGVRVLRNNGNWNTLLASSSSICPGLTGCTYKIENDPDDMGGPTADTNSLVIIRGTGQYSSSTKDILVGFKRYTLPMPPGTLTSVGIGTTVDFAGSKFELDGNNWIPFSDDGLTPAAQDNNACGPGWPKFGIAVPNVTQHQELKDWINPGRADDIMGAMPNPPWNPPSPTPSIGARFFLTQDQVVRWADQLMAWADVTYPAGTILTNVELGTQAAPKIVAVDCTGYDPGDTCLMFNGTTHGAGILIVKSGKIWLRATSSWVGLLVVVGEDVSIKAGGGGGPGSIFYGAVIIGEGKAIDPKEFWAVNVQIRYSCDAINMANQLARGPFWWKEVM